MLALIQLPVVQVGLVSVDVLCVTLGVSVCHFGSQVQDVLDRVHVVHLVIPERFEFLLQSFRL